MYVLILEWIHTYVGNVNLYFRLKMKKKMMFFCFKPFACLK